MSVDKTIMAREATHGPFVINAQIAQEIKDVFHTYNWDSLTHVQREALEMIASKIARILNGHHAYKDHWHDIAGYAQLAEHEGD